MSKLARLCLPVALVAVVLAWSGSASALTISFIESGSETGNIVVTTDIAGATVTTSPESATLTATIPGVALTSPLSASVALRDGSLTGPISDILTVTVSTSGALTATFQSDSSENPLSGSPQVSLIETGLPQATFFAELAPEIGLHITTQSDLDPVQPIPEPSTLLLFGSSLAGVGAVLWRRYRHS